MANIYSIKSGLSTDPTVWSGGVVPVSGDRILISNGHAVTLAGIHEWGDDSTATVVINSVSTTNSITIEGTLKASRSVNSQLTANGNLVINARAGVIGFYDAGTAADPIPLGVTHTCLLNKSAALAVGKYGLELIATSTLIGKISAHGYARRRNAVLIGAVAAGATSAVVDNATGWQPGDQIIFAPTVAYDKEDVRTISTITPGSGATATITFSALTNAHANNSSVGNFTSNVVFSPYSTAGSGWAHMSLTNSTNLSATSGNDGAVHLCQTRFVGCGSSGSTAYRFGMLNLFTANAGAVDRVFDDFIGLVFYATGGGAPSSTAQLSMLYTRNRHMFNDIAMYNRLTGISASIHDYSNSVADFLDLVIYGSNSAGKYSSYSQGGCNVRVLGVNRFYGCGGYPVNSSSAFSAGFFDTVFGPTNNSRFVQPVNSSALLFERCDFGYTLGKGAATHVFSAAGGYWSSDVILRDCWLDAGLALRPSSYYLSLPSYKITIENKNADVTQQEIHTPPGSLYRDNAVNYRSPSALRLEPDSGVSYPASREIRFAASNGATRRVVGYLRKNSSYGSATRPSVTISGLGITPVSFTMSNSVDTWEQFDLSVTNSSGFNGNFTLTFSGQSLNANAACWLDGIYDAPFVLTYRHYGFQFDSGNVARTVNPVTVLSESAALALSGLSVNHGTQTLTISGSRTLSEVYDWVHAHLCQTANLSQPEFFTATGGGNYTCTYNVVLTGAITGAGALSMPGKTLTASGTSSVPISHNAGTFTAISVTGYTVGARLQVYNVTTATELYNDIPAGGTLNLNVQHTTNQTIRLRMARVVGLDADELIETTGLLTASGASFLLTPHPDAVYEANGIDGDTVTEFAADYPNVQIDINDPDGVTTPQRGYAWYMSGQMTAAGIAAFHGGMVADDQTNYMIQTSILDMRVQNVSAMPCVIAGGRLYREDGTSIFAAGVGPIQADPGKAYVASGASAATVASAVRTELATELGRLDVAVGSRLATAGYTAPDNASVTAIKVKTDNLPADPASNTQVNTRLATAGYTAPPEASAVATAVRGELATELGRVDAAVSTRLAGAAYVAPDNAGIAAIPTNPLLVTDARINHLDADVSSRLPTAGYTAPDNTGISSVAAKLPSGGAKMAGEGVTAKNLDQVSVDVSGLATAAQVAAVPAGVRNELAVELDRMDAAVSSRLALADYTAPDNASVAAIKVKTDNLPADPASGATVAAETAGAVWAHPFVSRLLTVAKFLGLK